MRYWIYITCLMLSACGTLQDGVLAMRDAGIQPEMESFSPSKKLLADGSCPDIKIIEDLQMVHDFVPGAKPLPQTLISRIDIVNATTECTAGQKNVTAKTNIAFTALRGAASQNPIDPVIEDYFIAVTSESGRIMAKEIFPVSVRWDATQNRFIAQDVVRQIIPLQDYQHGNDFNIMIGFQLSDSDLKFNRDLLAAQKEAKANDETVSADAQTVQKAEISKQHEAVTATDNADAFTAPINLTPKL